MFQHQLVEAMSTTLKENNGWTHKHKVNTHSPEAELELEGETGAGVTEAPAACLHVSFNPEVLSTPWRGIVDNHLRNPT